MTLAVAVGDPGGIGPEVSVRAAASCEGCALFGDAAALAELGAAAGIGAERFVVLDPDGSLELAAGAIGLVDVRPASTAHPPLGRPTAEGGRAQLAALDAASRAVARGAARALVTGPVSKPAAVLAGAAFVGQTEYLAERAGLRPDAVTMMFLGQALRTALVTTHLPLAGVPVAVTHARVVRAAIHLGEALVALRAPGVPTVLVAGLNPHAGDAGLFGVEEAQVIHPALRAARTREPFASGRVRLGEVEPAEAAFRRAAGDAAAGVLAMYHDQATVASKLLDWGRAVNVTWGLPFVRTSVDHGVAYDLVGRGAADPAGMLAALRLAARLTGGAP